MLQCRYKSLSVRRSQAHDLCGSLGVNVLEFAFNYIRLLLFVVTLPSNPTKGMSYRLFYLFKFRALIFRYSSPMPLFFTTSVELLPSSEGLRPSPSLSLLARGRGWTMWLRNMAGAERYAASALDLYSSSMLGFAFIWVLPQKTFQKIMNHMEGGTDLLTSLVLPIPC